MTRVTTPAITTAAILAMFFAAGPLPVQAGIIWDYSPAAWPGATVTPGGSAWSNFAWRTKFR
jgi:hypothetical protein